MISAFGVDHGVVAKAFSPERSRHNRQAAYEGAAAGGAVVSGAGAVRAARSVGRHRKAASESSKKAGRSLNTMNEHLMTLHHDAKANQPGFRQSVASSAANAGKSATAHLADAAKEGKRAVRAVRTARGLGVGAAGLAATAYGIHRYDEKGSGRSYGYR